MPKLLIVDDEEGYRDELRRSLARDGHEIETADSGRSAIDVGAQFRPDVLIVDWMLRSGIHGLHVTQVLRTVRPDCQTILITGFASQHLQSEAAECDVFRFIEKPFRLDDLHTAVAEAANHEPTYQSPVSVGLAEIDADMSIRYANPTGLQMLRDASGNGLPESLVTALPECTVSDLATAEERWIRVQPAGSATDWHVRSKPGSPPDARIIVFAPSEKQYLRNHPVLNMLLHIEDPKPARWPLKGQALILDDEELVRRVLVAELQRVGCVCHAAENGEVAARLFERDPGISLIVIDHDIPGTDVAAFVRRARELRPDVMFVGTSGHYRKDEFQEMGVRRFLLKPWRIDDLINVVLDRIGNCVDCGLPLPLKRPFSTDADVPKWVCTGCGARYAAIFDDTAPADRQRNVQPG